MVPWLWFWSPQLYFPWSGSVAQRIEPNTSWFFDAILPSAGGARIERKAFDVASYGRQLGLITEVLLELAARQRPLDDEAAQSLGRLKSIRAEIEQIKKDEAHRTARQIEAQVRELKTRSAAEFQDLIERLRPLLDDGQA